MSNQKGYFAIEVILFVIAMSVLGVAGYWYFSRPTQSADQATLSPTPTTAQAVASPTPDQTVDWATYENVELGVSFKYPEWWERELTLDSTQSYDWSVKYEAKPYLLGGVAYSGTLTPGRSDIRRPLFKLAVYQKDSNSNLEAWIKQNDINASNNNYAIEPYPLQVSGQQSLFVGLDQVYIASADNVYVFSMGYTKYSGYPEVGFQQLFDQILSTVKFH